MAFHNVRMREFFQSIDLPFEHLLCRPVPDGLQIYDFNCDLLSCFFIDTPEDTGAETLANKISESVGIVLDFLPHFIVAGCKPHLEFTIFLMNNTK